MKIKVKYVPSEYHAVFDKLLFQPVHFIREWIPAWYKEVMSWKKN